MSESLRDQLMSLGFQPSPKPQRQATKSGKIHHAVRPDGRARAKRSSHPPVKHPLPVDQSRRRSNPGKAEAARDAEIDLAKAYAIRAQKEKQERLAAEQLKQARAEARQQAKKQLDALVKDKALNHPDAEIARYFPYGGKIKRVFVTAEQLEALNQGQLGVLQIDGHYLLLSRDEVEQAEKILPSSVALKI